MKIGKSKKSKKKNAKSKKHLEKNQELLLNIIGNKSSLHINNILSSNMQNSKDMLGVDILRSRRIILNKTCNQVQQTLPWPTNYQFSFNNTQQFTDTSENNVQFSSNFLSQTTIPRFNNRNLTFTQKNTQLLPNKSRQHFKTYNELPKFIRRSSNKPRSSYAYDDDVECLGIGQADNSVIPVNSKDASCIAIDDTVEGDDSNSSVFMLDDTITNSTPDLSKFEIVVTNTNYEQNITPESNIDDSVIFVEPENVEMEHKDDVAIETCEKMNSSVITIPDEEGETDSVFQRKIRIPNNSSIVKKKNQIKKITLRPFATVSNKKILTPSERLAKHKEFLDKPSETKVSEPAVTPNLINLTEDNTESNMYNVQPVSKNGLREIIIDGSNVALGHTNGTSYSIEGLQIVIDYFVKRGHKVRAFVPQFRVISGRSTNPELLRQLVKDKHVILTPSRSVTGRRITPYDDRFIIQYATSCEGIVVSSDCYRDLINEKPEWRNTIENRLLMPTWIDNVLMFPEDPLGRFGPTLTEFLKFPDS